MNFLTSGPNSSLVRCKRFGPGCKCCTVIFFFCFFARDNSGFIARR